MRGWAKLLLLVSTLAATACANAGLFAANVPTHFGRNVAVTHDIVFSDAPQLGLDIYRPAHATGPLPVIVFFYGGRWETGRKAQYAFAGEALAQRGFVVVVPDYRKYPQVKFPAFVEDGAAAVAWAKRNIAAHGGDASRLYVAGHSAGGHIGALIATDARYLARHGLRRDAIAGFAGLAGPYSFTPDEPDLQDMFGPPERYADMQVTSFVDGKQPPMLLLWGADDKSVGQFNMQRLEAAIHTKGGVVESKVYPGVNHAWLVGALSWLGRNKAPVADDMTAFFNKTER